MRLIKLLILSEVLTVAWGICLFQTYSVLSFLNVGHKHAMGLAALATMALAILSCHKMIERMNGYPNAINEG